jgi:hypothetical protein
MLTVVDIEPVVRAAPSLLISLPLEGRPRVQLVALHYDEEARLRDWIEATGFVELVDRALELAEEEPAA